jgi:hypothetical protein
LSAIRQGLLFQAGYLDRGSNHAQLKDCLFHYAVSSLMIFAPQHAVRFIGAALGADREAEDA